MSIDTNLLTHLQKLANISLKEQEIEQTKEHLNEIINFIENINNLDLENIPTFFSQINSALPMREDIPISNTDIAKDILKNAPKSEDNFFIVPKIIE
ncbi:Asp-tRNA(Asn)/Glu-tRNA(Gln) amidotransferase subunit GatC [Helicobacter mesocricetorum]|uniref:Asp-tRNA(Asn)/Glu-tRNA(Gln) amidotransferase subunit GatC n=1 Tax=Helicobacter mesocricetorum TaxID=87012 RepID=UPI000CF175B0|nr:Asp-tRNA(Asn)/Glu-tRNA(Gln) amidotransferase subunit GatC [Helicobacter mesocricetorum]